MQKRHKRQKGQKRQLSSSNRSNSNSSYSSYSRSSSIGKKDIMMERSERIIVVIELEIAMNIN